jgi:signal transduction histidine kinase/CheY-like chemotaxis protein
VGIAAPIDESPLKNMRDGLLLVGVVSLILAVIAAMIASVFLARPYKTINGMVDELVQAREEALASADAKTDFLANMSHEMRTPLNAIIGLTELTLDSGEISESVKENIENVYNSGVTLLSLINDILDISKIDSGMFELIDAEYDTPSLINDTVTLNIVRIGSKLIDFNLKIAEDLPSLLIGDELRVKQIFNNLLSNAFKYTKEGQVDWSISCKEDGDSIWIISSVRDTGIGIRPEDVGKLFSQYNQVDTKSNRKIEGTGLGLTICKNIVELMDGTITVESDYGRGSTFSVRFRQRKVNDIPIGEEVASNLRNFRYSANKRDRSSKLVRAYIPYAHVLVVDDVPTNLDVARGMMKPYGMKIDCVTSGPAAIELIRKEEVRYNAIFMDHMMPGMDGIEATSIIRNEIGTEYARNVPILALTANAIVGNEDMFLDSGFQAFLSKPIDIMKMDIAINHWVRDKELEKANPQQKKDEREQRSGEDRRTGEERRSFLERRGDSGKQDIEGLSFEKGLARFEGEEEIYMDVLQSYRVHTPPLLEQLTTYTEESLPAYAVIVHGIKSSSYSIGAESLGARAEALEHAAKDGDIAFVNLNNDVFIERAEKLIRELAEMLQSYEEENPKPIKPEPDRNILTDLLEACKAFDIDGVDNAMNELESYAYEKDGELVEWLRSQVSLMGFRQIAERLKTIL